MAGLLDIDLAGVQFMKLDQEFQVDPDLSFHLFPSLPYELRLEIIEDWLRSRGDTYWTPGDLPVVRSCGPYRRPSRLRNPLAEYATINKQWKFVVERETFRSLTFVIPEFGRNTLLDAGERIYRSSIHGAFDEPDALDEFGRICIKDRINAVLKLDISVNPRFPGGMRTHARLETMFCDTEHDDNTAQEIVRMKHMARVAFEKVLQTLERFQQSKLKSLDINSEFEGLRMADPMLTTPPSLHLGQCLYAMTCRLEELNLRNVVNLPYFLAESWVANGTTQDRTPAWPKLRILRLQDYASLEPSDHNREAAELHKAVTQALPQLPNLMNLDAALSAPGFVDVERLRRWKLIWVSIRMWPRNDHSAVRDGRLRLVGRPAPEPETLHLWRQIARRQWDCDLEVGEEYSRFTPWRGS